MMRRLSHAPLVLSLAFLLYAAPLAAQPQPAPQPAKQGLLASCMTKIQGLSNAVNDRLRSLCTSAKFRAADLNDAKDRFARHAMCKVREIGNFMQTGQRAADPAAQKTCVAVFLDGKNNLDSYGYKDIDEMVKGTANNPNVFFVVQQGTLKDTAAKRYLIQNGEKKEIDSLASADFGNPEQARDFFQWVENKYPGNTYTKLCWDHGGGDAGDLWDDKTGNHFNLSEEHKAFTDDPKGNSVIVWDVCLAQMIERARQLDGKARYMVASEETEPGNGHDYTGFAKKFLNGNLDQRAQCKAWVDSYVDSYSNGSQGKQAVQASAIDMEKLRGFMPRFRIFAKELVNAGNNGEMSMLSQQAAATQEFYLSTQRDLYDFASRVSANAKSVALKTAADEMMKYLDSGDGNGVIVANRQNSSSYKNAHGLAIWLPAGGKVTDGYNKPEYIGYRATMMNAGQLVKAQRAADYSQLFFTKEAPEWKQFTDMLKK